MTSERFADLEQRLRLVLAPDLPVLAHRHPAEVEQRIRQILQEVLATGEYPLTSADRAGIASRLTAEVLGG